jgi:hypothetical protein
MPLRSMAREWGWVLKAAVTGHRAVEGWERYFPMDRRDGEEERSLKAILLNDALDIQEKYECLFEYFLGGYLRYASPGRERVLYPGMGSLSGAAVDGLQGFARTSPLLAAWVYSNRGAVISDHASGNKLDMVSILREGLLAGTNKTLPVYWGPISDRDQRIVETADIARVLWLTRTQIWAKLSLSEQRQVAAWLLQVNSVTTPDNNWLLFPVVVNFALDALGYADNTLSIAYAYKKFYEFKENYLENGWFFDKPSGVDYYNAWGITYDIFWIHLLRPNFDREFILDVLTQSASLTAHLVGPKGIPIMGRSIIYRTAVSVPVLAASFIDSSDRAQGLARRAMDAVWRYFVARGCLRNGTLTQGYFDTDPRLVERYMDPGSSHWGLRSLVLAYMHRPGSAFWTAAHEPLPVEMADYCLEFPKLGWVIVGRTADCSIRIRIPGNQLAVIRPQAYSIVAQIGERLARTPLRPHNHSVKYECAEYRSDNPLNLGRQPLRRC